MKLNTLSALSLLTVCGAPLAWAGVAAAQPSVINISGATLLENYVRSAASTNDFIDVDSNGVSGQANTGVQQLATSLTGVGGTYPGSLKWIVQYRVTGSVNGFIELARFGSGNPIVTSNDQDVVNGIPGFATGTNVTNSYANRTQFLQGSGYTGSLRNTANPGGLPYRSDISADAFAQYAAPNTAASGGIRIDVAPIDVPTFWAVQKTGTPAASRKPADAGYGANPRVSVNRQGTLTGFANLNNSLPGLLGRNLYNGVPAEANANTIFDTPLSYAVIVPIANPGTGVTQIKISELRHLFATGRLITGENLQAVTRESGSGTRNAFNNCIGLDPSFGVGDNIGFISTLPVNDNLGAQWTPTNKNASSGMEGTTRNARLGIGYSGGERGLSGSGAASWLVGSNPALWIPSVQNDIYGGTMFVQPTTTRIVNNSNNGWVIGGPAILATVGSPLAESIANGGTAAPLPAMFNKAASKYLNNIRKSIDSFFAVPVDPSNFGMPGEFAATQFTLTGALNNIPSANDATTLIANPNFNSSLQTYTLANSVYNNIAFSTPNYITAGNVPTRTTGVVYSDGVLNGANYTTRAGATVLYASSLVTAGLTRNKIAGDFNNNGARNIDDSAALVGAYRERYNTVTWTGAGATSDAVIELLGDFDGNGSFDLADARYFADGLAIATTGINAGKLDRKAGFTAIDIAWTAQGGTGRIFGTTLATPKAYAAGDSRGDVAGAAGTARGWAPVGANGVVNAADIDYVSAQFMTNPAVTDGAATWSNLDEAATFDLSADMTGDLIVDQADVTELVTVILGTSFGDVNLDGVVDSADISIITGNLNTAGGWARGDMDGNGIVNAADLAIANANIPNLCLADVASDSLDTTRNGNGSIGSEDLDAFIAGFISSNAAIADVASDSLDPTFNPNGSVGSEDLDAFISAFINGNC